VRELITQRWSELEPLVEVLLELAPEARRPWLEEHCPYPELRAAVLVLIEHDSDDDGPISHLYRELTLMPDDYAERRIGPYRLLEKLGEGGMAVVYLAERDTAEFRQRVALKLMRGGVYTRADQALFQREQRLHARLEHPHIARMLDSGISAAGIPYFAMEYVDGERITLWCDERRLDLGKRLELFLLVCDAVQYAHQNLIVHRDMKPSNIFVTRDGAPKLLDFGIAKLLRGTTDGGFTADETQTQTAMRRFTPGYAAPEQISGAAITTATDVYALGILLQELLTGVRPQNAKDDTVRPASARFAELPPDEALVAAHARALAPLALMRALRGDLDGLIAKALRGDPARRYPGAQALADDVRRHLAGQPISARPDSFAYRAGKFLHRHRIGIASAAAIVATLIIASIYSLHQATLARAQAARAEQEATRANAAKTFLLDVFNDTEPGETKPIETAEGLLARSRERIPSEFADKPDLQVELLGTIGSIERRRGHLSEARAALDAATALAQDKLGAADTRSLDVAVRAAGLAEAEGRFDSGRDALQQVLTPYRAAHPQADAFVASALAQLAEMDTRLRDEQAIATANEAVAMYRHLANANPLDLASALSTLGEAQQIFGHPAEAVPVLEEGLRLMRSTLGGQHVYVAETLAAIAASKRDLGELGDAEQLLRDALAIDREIYPGPNPKTAITLNDLAVTLRNAGKLDESGRLLEETLTMQKQIYAGDHPYIAATLRNLGAVRQLQNRNEEAESLLRYALAMDTRVRAPNHPLLALDHANLAKLLIARKRLDEAQHEIDAALAADRQRDGGHGERVANDLVVQAQLDAADTQHEHAVEQARNALALFRDALPPGHRKIADARLVLAASLEALGEYASAKTECEGALGTIRSTQPPSQTELAHALACLGRADLALGQSASAATALREAIDVLQHDQHSGDSAAVELGELRQLLEKTATTPTTR